jgi:negative modulator of initiation of replication
MRTIEIDEDIYAYLCSQTHEFGEAPSTILRRLLRLQALDDLRQPHPDSNDFTGISDETRNSPAAPSDSRTEKEPPFEPATDEPPGPTQTTSELAQFLQTKPFTGKRNALGRFLALLSWFHQRHGDEFEAVTQVRGRRRTYFAKAPEEIERTGRSTKPQPVPGTPWYITTNTSLRLKQVILRKVMTRLAYNKEDIQQAAALLDPRHSRAWTY